MPELPNDIENMQEHYKKLPAVNSILDHLKEQFSEVNPLYLKRLIVDQLESIRQHPAAYTLEKSSKDELQVRIHKILTQQLTGLINGSLVKVINATGVVLHTGMGRAPVDPKMLDNLKEVSRYSNLEIDIMDGKRGQRLDHISPLLRLLTGAEDGLAVNNNAAAVMLMLNTVGRRKEVIISRGELIEIGGSFRMPEVMTLSGCKLCEVGTTNKTHLKDYEAAISRKTGAILICHPSNYEVQGFTNKPEISDIVAVGKKYKIPVIYDLGSGSLIDTHHFGSDTEPVVPEMAALGLDLISFSGDKLLGGPQAGIIVGKKYWIERCKKNQLLRALRLDKFMIKVLQTTLTEYLKSDSVPFQLSAIHSLTRSEKELKNRCKDFIQSLPGRIQSQCTEISTVGKVGSGAYPILELPSWAVVIDAKNVSPSKLAKKLRNWRIPIFSYIENDQVYLDLRTVFEEELPLLRQAIADTLQ